MYYTSYKHFKRLSAMSTLSVNTVRIQLKASPIKKELIDKAAKLLNISRTDFMLSTATQYAEEVLLDRREHIVADSTFDRFAQLMQEPFTTNKKLSKALGKTKPWN
tara:strand:- start:97355 stop:97672 length:318 start_codon:yes stop_codon:yes gene_type:complete